MNELITLENLQTIISHANTDIVYEDGCVIYRCNNIQIDNDSISFIGKANYNDKTIKLHKEDIEIIVRKDLNLVGIRVK